MTIVKLIVSVFLWITISLFNANAQENDNYLLNEVVNNSNRTEVIRAVLSTFNDFGYYIDTLNDEQGLIVGEQIVNERIPPLKDMRHYKMDRVIQSILIKVSSENDQSSKISIGILYRKILVEDLAIYKIFMERIKSNLNL